MYFMHFQIEERVKEAKLTSSINLTAEKEKLEEDRKELVQELRQVGLKEIFECLLKTTNEE
jgi:hypothetical protein